MNKLYINPVKKLKASLKTLTKKRLTYISVIVLLIFGALIWFTIQQTKISQLEEYVQYKQDIEKAFVQIDELNLSMLNRISDQEIRTDENIDEKGINDFIQFKYSYLDSESIDRKIDLTKQYSIVFQKQLKKWQEDEVVCHFHVCKQYAQYVNEYFTFRDLYKASKKKIDTELSSESLEKFNSEAFNL